MKYQEKCDCCGNKITAYTHNLNKPLIGALRQLVDFYDDGGGHCNLARDLKLTHNQLANFQKLKYFGLVLDVPDGWIPTIHGREFIHGAEKVYNPVATFKNEVLPFSHPAWQTHSKPVLVGVRDVDEASYKQREAYASEKSGQGTLLN